MSWIQKGSFTVAGALIITGLFWIFGFLGTRGAITSTTTVTPPGAVGGNIVIRLNGGTPDDAYVYFICPDNRATLTIQTATNISNTPMATDGGTRYAFHSSDGKAGQVIITPQYNGGNFGNMNAFPSNDNTRTVSCFSGVYTSGATTAQIVIGDINLFAVQ